ncbi:hypothetical protein T484DRAFT_3548379 [Baffinella frigidus]|nr:hypothetical protein T484DRAFT_3548379 [Cryptophyta sp. CCMP2293]
MVLSYAFSRCRVVVLGEMRRRTLSEPSLLRELLVRVEESECPAYMRHARTRLHTRGAARAVRVVLPPPGSPSQTHSRARQGARMSRVEESSSRLHVTGRAFAPPGCRGGAMHMGGHPGNSPTQIQPNPRESSPCLVPDHHAVPSLPESTPKPEPST